MILFSKRHVVLNLLLAMLICCMVAGCAPKTSSVSGTVKYKGQPLPSGTITFMCQAGEKKVAGTEIKDGNYSAQNLNPGPVQVSIVTIAPSKGGAPPGGGKAIEDPNASNTHAGKYVPIPQKYASGEKSGLDFELKGGPQTKDFDLTP